MKSTCAQLRTAIADLAEGRESPDAAAHIANCRTCAALFAQMRAAIQGLRSGFADAPSELILSAKAIFPRTQPVFARLVSPTLGTAGARGGDAFQALYEFEDGRVRVMYRPEPDGWTVMGRIEAEGWTIVAEDLDSEGRFQFSSQSLSDAEILLRKGDAEVVIPAPEGP